MKFKKCSFYLVITETDYEMKINNNVCNNNNTSETLLMPAFYAELNRSDQISFLNFVSLIRR